MSKSRKERFNALPGQKQVLFIQKEIVEVILKITESTESLSDADYQQVMREAPLLMIYSKVIKTYAGILRDIAEREMKQNN